LLAILKTAKVELKELLENDSWTIAVIEGLRDEARKISELRLRWILSTAMPLEAGFSVFLNGNLIQSSKDDIQVKYEFRISELKEDRLKQLSDRTGIEWKADSGQLICALFPSGINGTVRVFERSVRGGKSDDLRRSHGFFIRVHGCNDPVISCSGVTF